MGGAGQTRTGRCQDSRPPQQGAAHLRCSFVASCSGVNIDGCCFQERLVRFAATTLVRCSDLLLVFVPPGWNVAERSDLPGDLRLLGRAAAFGCGHPGSGPLLGLYESQPSPAELLLELLDQPSARPGFRKDARKAATERNCQKKETMEYLLSRAPE